MTIASKLVDLNNIKGEIRTAIIAKGVPVPEETPFREYDDKIALISGGGGGGGLEPEEWIRPSDWMAMPTINSTDDKIAILFRVSNTDLSTNVLEFIGVGIVDIDWGDGTTALLENLNTTPKKEYNYNDLSSNPYVRQDILEVEFTTTATSTTITTAAPVPGIELGMLVIGTGIPDHTTIVSQNSSTSWEISNAATASGTVILELTKEFYRQALCIITASTSITSFYFTAVADTLKTKQALSIKASLPNISSTCRFGHSTTNAADIRSALLEEFELVNYSSAAMTGFLQNLRMLKKVTMAGTGSVLRADYCFYNCHSLQEVSLNNNSMQNYNDMFNGCFSLLQINFTEKVLKGTTECNASNMFNSCYTLRELPFTEMKGYFTGFIYLITTAESICNACWSIEVGPKVTADQLGGSRLFNNCYNLKYLTDTPSITISTSTSVFLFQNCVSLEYGPDVYCLGGLASMSSTYSGCSSLVEGPYLEATQGDSAASAFANCTNMVSAKGITLRTSGTIQGVINNVFNGCRRLKEPPPIVGALRNTSNMFYRCHSLEKPLDPSVLVGAQQFQGMYYECHKIETLPAYDYSTAIAFDAFGGNHADRTNLKRMLGTGITVKVTLDRLNLSREAIVEVFENLGTASGSQTLTYTNNPGTADITAADKLIATDKGWTLNPA